VSGSYDGPRQVEVSGGFRIIYYVRHANGVIWMLTMYPKNAAENISAHVLRQIKKEVDDG
jgi:hypothetical protein